MKNGLKLCVFIFLNIISSSHITASDQDTAEIVTAFLRGPAAYYEFKLAKTIHPDKTHTDSNEQFAKILAAYQRLYGSDD